RGSLPEKTAGRQPRFRNNPCPKNSVKNYMSDKIDWPSIAAHHLLERDKPFVLQFNAVRGNQSKDDVSRSNVNLLARKLFATCFGSVHIQRRWLVRRESLGKCPVRLQFVGAVY